MSGPGSTGTEPGSGPAGSDLAVDAMDVVRMADQNLLVDQLPPVMLSVLPVPNQRQRSLVVFINPGSPPRRPELRLHSAGSRLPELGPISSLNAVVRSWELRRCYRNCVRLETPFRTSSLRFDCIQIALPPSAG